MQINTGENKMKNQTYEYLKKVAYMHNISLGALHHGLEVSEEANKKELALRLWNFSEELCRSFGFGSLNI